jgi:hypothetical protein
MKTFLQWAKSLLDASTYGQRLESYITSKNPTNIADVEYWANTFERHVQKGLV